MQDFEWISKKGSAGYDGMTTAPAAAVVGGTAGGGGGEGSSSLSSSRGVKEQSEGLGGKVRMCVHQRKSIYCSSEVTCEYVCVNVYTSFALMYEDTFIS